MYASMEVMLAKGFNAARVDEICAAAGVTKGAFFHYFKTKADLGHQVLELYFTNMMALAEEGDYQGEQDSLQRLYRYVEHMIDMSRDPRLAKGCLLGALTQELSMSLPAFREQCAGYFTTWAGIFCGHVEAAMADHPPQLETSAEELASMFLSLLEGSILLSRAHGDGVIVAQNMRHFGRYLRLVFEGARAPRGIYSSQ